MTIEEIIVKLKDQGIAAVMMIKANVDYSVVPLTREEYNVLMLKEHYNDTTIKKALNKLLKRED